MSAKWSRVFLLVLLVVVSACTAGPAASPAPASISVADTWVRASTGTQTPTAAYLVIDNGGTAADALVAASTPLAAKVEIHETTTSGGMTGMHPVDRLEIPAGGTVRLEPGGVHLMLMGLTGPVEPGTTVSLELRFEHAGTIVVQAPVRPG